MEKFGLRTGFSVRNNAIEMEIVKEQASALGRAGKKLRLSLESYSTQLTKGRDHQSQQSLIKEISDNVWALILQREFLGFTDNNLAWVTENYFIPEQAISMLGEVDCS